LGSPVCEIDLEVDSFLRERLTELDPEAGWLSEETLDASDRMERTRLWVVDLEIDLAHRAAQGLLPALEVGAAAALGDPSRLADDR
jgi:hypothetical protein